MEGESKSGLVVEEGLGFFFWWWIQRGGEEGKGKGRVPAHEIDTAVYSYEGAGAHVAD